MNKSLLILLLLQLPITSYSKELDFFASYELLEMSANNFSEYAIDVGAKLDDGNQIRIVLMDVNLTESHLSSEWAQIVEGKNVKGNFKGVELNYDYFIDENWYIMANISKISMAFQHILLPDSYKNTTYAIGSGFGYKEQNIFGSKGLFYNVSVPFRYFFEPVEETKLGESTINRVRLAPSLWFFVGYDF